MRELNRSEVAAVAGGNMFGHLVGFTQSGLTCPEQTLALTSLSLGVAVGGLLSLGSVWLTPICSAALLGGWYFFTSEKAQEDVSQLFEEVESILTG